MYKFREDILNLLLSGKIRLNRYDEKFIADIIIIIDNKKMITSNQSSLFEKIVRKYQRQFEKQHLDVEQLLLLPWKTSLVESSPKYTDAFLYIEHDEIHFRCPWNRKFISDLSEIPYRDKLIWDKHKKEHIGPMSTTMLKALVLLLTMHYSVVNFCPVVTQLISSVEQFGTDVVWKPTLIKLGELYLIAASNEYIDSAIKNIPLSDDLQTLYQLGLHGIEVSPSILDDPAKKFAASTNLEIDIEQIDQMLNWIKSIGIKGIVFPHLLRRPNLNIMNEIAATAEKLKLAVHYKSNIPAIGDVALIYATSVPSVPAIRITKEKGSTVCKIIKITNSRPVNIK